MRVKILIGLGIAISMDLGMGIFIAHASAKFLGVNLNLMGYAAAMFLALLPDLDVITEKILKGRVTGKHKEAATLFHIPSVVITGIAFLLSFISPFWLATGSLLVLAHFLHDSMEGGPGIKWLAPFSEDSYRLFHKGKCIYRLSEAELQHQYSITMEMWLERVYLKPTINAISGIMVLLGALLCAWLW